VAIVTGWIVWIMREPLRGVIGRIEEFALELKEMKTRIKIARDIEKAAKKVPLDKEQTKTINFGSQLPITSVRRRYRIKQDEQRFRQRIRRN
jgi:hypothetical protein